MANLSSLEKTHQLNINPVVLLALEFLIFISYIFVFSNTICSRITTLLCNRITTLLCSRITTLPYSRILLFFMYFFFLLDFWFLLGLGSCNPNRSRRYNFVSYIKAPYIHFFQWTINKRLYFQLSLIRISQSSSLLVVGCPVRLNYWWEP